MSNLPTCPPIVPPAFEPSAAARDELARAERALAAASDAARAADDNARSAKAATAAAELAFASEDTDERWQQFEGARRRETSARLRAERCASELTEARAALDAARAGVERERIEHAKARASTLRLIENMREPLAQVAKAVRLLLTARGALAAAEREHFAAINALRSLAGPSAAQTPMVEFSRDLAQYVAGLVALEMGGSKSPNSDGVSFAPGSGLDISNLILGRWRQSLPLAPEADAMLRDLAREALE